MVLYDCWKFIGIRVNLVRELSELGVRRDVRNTCKKRMQLWYSIQVLTKRKDEETEEIHVV